MYCNGAVRTPPGKTEKPTTEAKMKKRQQTKVPEKFWTTPEGAALYDTLHSDGWDAVDMLNSVKEAFDKAIDETQDAEIKAELEKSRSLVIQSKKAYLKAANRLRHIF